MHLPAYNGRVRRTLRVGAHFANIAPTSFRSPLAVINCHWWGHTLNFGDLLTPPLLAKFGIFPVNTAAPQADLVGVGSLLQHLGPESRATLWGSGLINDAPHPLPDVRPLAVRGHLTAERIGRTDATAHGDPGMLLPFLMRSRSSALRRYRIGVIPHYQHLEDPEYQRLAATIAGDDSVRIIEVRRTPIPVARDIASCERIVTSSLHGLIVADALGIPAVWVRGSIDLVGGEFKFHDHETVVRPAGPRRLFMADLESFDEAAAQALPADMRAVECAQGGLVRAGHQITEHTRHRYVSGVKLPFVVGPEVFRPVP